jgi:hypothetical protein
MEKKYIIYIIIVFIVFVVFMPVYLTINFDSKFLREDKRSTTVLIPSHSTRDVTIRFDSPLYQVSKHEIIPPKKNVTITEQINFPCQKQVYITYFQKVIE